MKDLIKFAALTITFIAFMFALGAYGNTFDYGYSWGVVKNEESLNVNYLVGEACIVNMTDDVAVDEINSNMVWCMEQHINYLASEKK